jgi:phosphate transport system protein
MKRDSDLAQKTIASDDAVNDLELVIDEMCLKLLALRQPMAIDLRFITAAMKIVTDLERMGDQAVNIAERALSLNQEPQLKPYIDIPRMAEIAQSMVKDVLDAFVNRDPKLARSVCEKDDVVDGLNDQVVRELLTYMMSDPKAIPRAVHLMIVSRCLERIADHATNIAEDVIFMVDALVIKHHADEKKEEEK